MFTTEEEKKGEGQRGILVRGETHNKSTKNSPV